MFDHDVVDGAPAAQFVAGLAGGKMVMDLSSSGSS
jgi:hypothetical protein